MASERVQRQIDRLLNEAEEAIILEDWSTVSSRARSVLRIDPDNSDELAYLAAAERDSGATTELSTREPAQTQASQPSSSFAEQPTSFSNGRYEVKRILGEGGKKKVYLAQDTTLDRQVAFALIKTRAWQVRPPLPAASR